MGASCGDPCPVCGSMVYVHEEGKAATCSECGRPKDPPVQEEKKYIVQPMD